MDAQALVLDESLQHDEGRWLDSAHPGQLYVISKDILSETHRTYVNRQKPLKAANRRMPEQSKSLKSLTQSNEADVQRQPSSSHPSRWRRWCAVSVLTSIVIHCLEQAFGRVYTLRSKIAKESIRLVNGEGDADDTDEFGPYGLYRPINGRKPSAKDLSDHAKVLLRDGRFMHSGMVDGAVSNLLAPVDHLANYCYTQGKPH
jgi:hypothetical protein